MKKQNRAVSQVSKIANQRKNKAANKENQENGKGGLKMKKLKKAIGYVCDIPILRTDEVIGKEDQKARILKYAQKENLEIICIFEDEEYTKDFMNRPGVKDILEYTGDFDVLLVERAWCMTRKIKEIKPLLEKLDARKIQLVATSYLWDCVSQHIRHRGRETLVEKSKKAVAEMKQVKHGKKAA